MNSCVKVVLAAVLGGLGALSASTAQEEPAAGRTLDIVAHEYSRFEISKDDVVAFYTGGVEFDYLGYHLKADELRYNHSTQEANASGDVTITLDGLTAYTEQILINGSLGQVSIPQPLAGVVQEPAISFEAGACNVEFPADRSRVTLSDMQLHLSGGVVITAQQQSRLTCAGLDYDGSTRRVTSSGQVVLSANYGVRELSNGAQLDLSELQITAASIAAQIAEDGTIQTAEMSQVAVAANGAELLAQQARLTNLAPDADDLTDWSAELTGVPLVGSFTQSGQSLEFRAARLTFRASASELQQLRFEDAVEIVYAGSRLAGDVFEVELRPDGYAISMPAGLNAAFDLSRYSGSESAFSLGSISP